jgi:hypothetical protein
MLLYTSVFFFVGCGEFLTATCQFDNRNAFNRQRLIWRLFRCGIAYFLHVTYVALCCRDVDEYVVLHRDFLEFHMAKSEFLF